MNDPLPDAESPPAIHSPASWQAALGWGVAAAAAREARRITWVDTDFAAWPLDDPALLEALTGWLRLPQRRLVVLAHGYDDMPRRFARFTGWRRKFGHAVETRSVSLEVAPELPSVLVDDGPVSVHLIDGVRWRGRAAIDARTATLWRERIDVILQRSDPAFAVDTLGL